MRNDPLIALLKTQAFRDRFRTYNELVYEMYRRDEPRYRPWPWASKDETHPTERLRQEAIVHTNDSHFHLEAWKALNTDTIIDILIAESDTICDIPLCVTLEEAARLALECFPCVPIGFDSAYESWISRLTFFGSSEAFAERHSDPRVLTHGIDSGFLKEKSFSFTAIDNDVRFLLLTLQRGDEPNICDLAYTIHAPFWSGDSFCAHLQDLRTSIETPFQMLDATNHFDSDHEGDRSLIDLERLARAFWTTPQRKDTYDKRFRNCITLIRQAQDSPHSAVRVALFCSALEALLGQKNDNSIANALASRATVLLQPIRADRSQSIHSVKSLYNIRSRLLHGEDTRGQRAAADAAYLLTCAVLAAILEWERFAMRAGYSDHSPASLLDELDRSLHTGSSLDVIPRRLREFLPDHILSKNVVGHDDAGCGRRDLGGPRYGMIF